MADRTPAQIGASNRAEANDAERKVAQYLEAHGLGNGAANLAGYGRDHGDYGPVTDRDGDLWAIEREVGSQPQPGQVEAWAEAAREASHAGAPPVGADRAPAGCADVGRWWAYLPVGDVGRHHRSGCGPIANGPTTRWCRSRLQTLRAWVALVAPDQEATA